MSVHLRRKFLVFDWKGTFPIEGSMEYTLKNEVTISRQKRIEKHSYNRQIEVCVMDTLKGDFSRLLSLKTNSLDIRLRGKAVAHQHLVKLLAGVYDVLLLEVKFDGTILKINNHEVIKDRWSEIKSQIEADYKGREIERFIKGVGTKIASEKGIIKELETYDFFGLFFNELYQQYDSATPITEKKTLRTLLGLKEITEERNIDTLEEEIHQVTLRTHSHKKSDHVLIDTSGNYMIDTKTNWIKEATLKVIEDYEGTTRENTFLLIQKAG